MTTATATATAPLIAKTTAKAQPVKFINVLAVEFRKLTSTLANRILLLAMGATILIGAVGVTLAHRQIFETGMPWMVNQNVMLMFVMLLFSPLIALMVTSEWSTRSIMTTFTLAPRRGQTIAAKFLVAVLSLTAIWLICTGLGAASYVAGAKLENMPISWPITWVEILGDWGVYLTTTLMVFAVALLIHDGPAAIVIALGTQPVLSTLAMFPILTKVVEWVHLANTSQVVLLDGDTSAMALAKFGVSAAIWIIIPLVLGSIRTMRREAS